VFHIERKIHDFVVLTHVHGELDLNVLDDVRQAFATALALTTSPFPMVVDLDGVTFLASCGLNELLATDKRAREQGGELRIVATRREVLRPLEITGLLELLDVRGSIEEALANVAPGAVPAKQN
jgi:anti-sigma B factor antagonist